MKRLIDKYIERIKIDYPEDDKLYMSLEAFAKEHHNEQLILHGVSKRTLKRICEHEDCNKEFTVELNLYGDKSKANVAMMQCPHCDKRNDLWLELS